MILICFVCSVSSGRNGLVYTGVTRRNFFLFKGFIAVLTFSKNTCRYGMFCNNALPK
jgi:hypothetical protein